MVSHGCCGHDEHQTNHDGPSTVDHLNENTRPFKGWQERTLAFGPTVGKTNRTTLIVLPAG